MLLLDVASGTYLVSAVAVKDGDAVVVEGDRVLADACGSNTLDASLADLRAKKAVVGGPSPTRALIGQGRELTRKKKYTDAIEAFEQAIEIDARAARAWSGMGFALLKKRDLDKAQLAFDKALTLSASRTFQAAVYFNLGLLAKKRGDKAAARAAFEKSHEKRPTKATRKKLGIKK